MCARARLQVVVKDFDGLMGLDSLRRMKNTAPPAVAESAASFLTTIFLRLQSELPVRERQRVNVPEFTAQSDHSKRRVDVCV